MGKEAANQQHQCLQRKEFSLSPVFYSLCSFKSFKGLGFVPWFFVFLFFFF